jgi:hypothetical protein
MYLRNIDKQRINTKYLSVLVYFFELIFIFLYLIALY